MFAKALIAVLAVINVQAINLEQPGNLPICKRRGLTFQECMDRQADKCQYGPGQAGEPLIMSLDA